MVADSVDVLSKKADIKESNRWSSNGKDSYTIEIAVAGFDENNLSKCSSN